MNLLFFFLVDDEIINPNGEFPVTAMTLPSQSKINMHAITALKTLDYR